MEYFCGISITVVRRSPKPVAKARHLHPVPSEKTGSKRPLGIVGY